MAGGFTARYLFTYKAPSYECCFAADEDDRAKGGHQMNFRAEAERLFLRRHPEAEGSIQFITA